MDSFDQNTTDGNVATLPENDATGMWIGGAAEQMVDRRSYSGKAPTVERRQFSNSYDGLSPAAVELAQAIDQYKINNRRRFITYEEILEVVTGLGYSK